MAKSQFLGIKSHFHSRKKANPSSHFIPTFACHYNLKDTNAMMLQFTIYKGSNTNNCAYILCSQAIVSYPDDKPVPNIDVRISAKAIKSDGKETEVGRHVGDIKDEANRDVTGPDGQAEFVIDIPRDVTTLKVKVC